MLDLLRNPAYFKLWCAQVVSELGDGVTHIVVIYLVSQLSSNPAVFSFVLMAWYIPTVLLGVFAGPLVDRFPRKWIMVGSDFYRLAILLLMIPFHHSVSALVILVFFQGIGTVFFEPAKTASIPSLIEEEQIPKAVGLSQSTFMTMNILAPSIGGGILLLEEVSWIFALDAATFLLSALLIIRLQIPSSKKGVQEEKESYLQSLLDGLRMVKKEDFLKGYIVLVVVTALVMSIVGAVVYDVVLNLFDVPELHFGMLESTEGIFGVLGALIVPYLMKKVNTNRLLLSVIGVTGVVSVGIAPVYLIHQTIPVVPLYVWMGFIGLLNTCLNVPLSSLAMQAVPQEVLGRISGLVAGVINGSFLGGVLIGGWLASMIGGMATVMCGGLLLLFVSLLFPLTAYYQALKVDQDQREFASA
ncbi:MFS transporter [Halobacillus salinus]|uniref:MFS transporter n=1 Tax=Halobacillus salinus TaxID=192814 RepID=A0A4Z0GXA4_9BACI|nr:MFS transporter [Halobacillus salinus]